MSTRNKNIVVEIDSDTESLNKQDVSETDKQTEDDSKFIKQCEELIDTITQNYKQQRDEIRKLMKLHKTEIKRIKKTKRFNKDRDDSGFTKATAIPDKLAEFIKEPTGTEMSRTLLTKKIYNEIKKRNLLYENDGRVFRADAEFKKLFDLPDSVNTSTNPKDKLGFNFYNLQKYIAKCYDEQNNDVNNENTKNDIKKTNDVKKTRVNGDHNVIKIK